MTRDISCRPLIQDFTNYKPGLFFKIAGCFLLPSISEAERNAMLIHDNISKKSHTAKEKGLQPITCNPLILLARPEGFEPSTSGFVVRRSIQLSYGRTLKVRSEYISCPA